MDPEFGMLGFGVDPWTPQVDPAMVPPVLPPMQPPGDISSALATNMAQQGIRPQDFMQNPAVAKLAVPQAPSMTSSWEPTPSGVDPRTVSPEEQSRSTQTPMNMAATSDAMARDPNSLAKNITSSLQGLKAPARPVAQTVRTPSPVAPHPVQRQTAPPQILALLQALGAKGASGPTNIPMPLGLGQR